MKQIDIQKIRDKVSGKHKDFIEKAGGQSRKLGADYTYNLERINAKIRLILNIFKEENIISETIEDDRVALERANRSFQLIVNGYEKTSLIEHSDRIITINDLSCKAFENDRETIIVEDIDAYDWEDFANRLLNYIHQTIYMRKESYALKIWGA